VSTRDQDYDKHDDENRTRKAKKRARDRARVRKRFEDPEYREKRMLQIHAYREACRVEINERRRIKYRSSPKDLAKRRARRYGISQDEYMWLLEHQQGACAICKTASDRMLCVDHCHSTGKVRGLLCHKCNLGLGFYGEDLEIMLAAMTYVAHGGPMELAKADFGSSTSATATRTGNRLGRYA
jgi:hypothetical protein